MDELFKNGQPVRWRDNHDKVGVVDEDQRDGATRVLVMVRGESRYVEADLLEVTDEES